ncbi:MAG: hypothetical protein ABIP35_01975 [Ginsengibacter sp.]
MVKIKFSVKLKTRCQGGFGFLVDVFQNVAGWWGHQPWQSAKGGVSTAHYQYSDATIWNAPFLAY